MTNEPRAADLVRTITAVPGVRGIEPGIASTMRTLDARVRGERADTARFGVVIDTGDSRVTIEVGLDGTRPIRQVVRAIQEAVLSALEEGSTAPGNGSGGDSDAGGRESDAGGRESDGAGPDSGDDDGARASCPARRDGGAPGGPPATGRTVTVRVQSLSS